MTKNHFEPGAYSNVTEVFGYDWVSPNATTGRGYRDIGDQTNSLDMQLFTSMLLGYNSSTPNYKDLTPSECRNLYKRDFLSSHRNLFLITKNNSEATHNNTLLDFLTISSISKSLWMCINSPGDSVNCGTNALASNVGSGLPWKVTLRGGEEAE